MEHSAKHSASALCKRARRKKKPPVVTAEPAPESSSNPQHHHNNFNTSTPPSPTPRVELHSPSTRPSPRGQRTVHLANEVDRRLSRTARRSLVDRPPVKLAPGAPPAPHPRLSSIISLETSSLDEVADAQFMRTVSSIRSVDNLVTANSALKDCAPPPPPADMDEQKQPADK